MPAIKGKLILSKETLIAIIAEWYNTYTMEDVTVSDIRPIIQEADFTLEVEVGPAESHPITCTECRNHGPNKGDGHSNPQCRYAGGPKDAA